MKKRTLLLGLCLLSLTALHAQHETAYEELPNPVAADAALWKNVTVPQVSWGSTDERYKKEAPAMPAASRKRLELTAWRGEKVSAQWVVWTGQDLESLSFSVSDLTAGKAVIPASQVEAGFVRYVMTDELNKDGRGACGYRNKADYDSSLVADAIDPHTQAMRVEGRTTRPGWLSVRVSRQAAKGTYTGTLTVRNGKAVVGTLKLTLRVKDRVLPEPADWKFHLDLWQNPYAVARYYGVEPFTPEHFRLMRPIMQRYADAGGKVITASIIDRPWNGQTYDPFHSMVTWMKKADGTWMYDYAVFDKWVEFMMSVGVKKQIDCYSMVPWKLSFRYYDQASDSFKYLDSKPGDKEYDEFWGGMLRSFAAHLKAKGWFGIAHIAMDERPMDAMLATMKTVRAADKDFKIALAGTYHDKLADELDDYCIPIGEKFPPNVIEARRKAGKVTTYYTCCAEPRPNTFTFSPPAEAEWLGWYAAKANLDGYVRWALNSWVEAPLHDSRFRTWAAGDTYLLYPDGRSSIRFERLVEGIQAYEKIRLLREQFAKENNRAALKKLDKILEVFNEHTLEKQPATLAVRKAKALLNSF